MVTSMSFFGVLPDGSPLYAVGPMAYTLTLTDSILLVESFSKKVSFYRTLSDTTILSDTLSKHVEKILSDDIKLIDTLAKKISMTFDESVTIIDHLILKGTISAVDYYKLIFSERPKLIDSVVVPTFDDYYIYVDGNKLTIEELKIDHVSNDVVLFSFKLPEKSTLAEGWDDITVIRGTKPILKGKIISKDMDSYTTETIYKGRGYAENMAMILKYSGSFVDSSLLTILTDILNDTDIQPTETITNESVGTGDGTTTIFYLANKIIKYDSQTIYLDGVAQVEDTDYTFDDAYGKITFVSPPAVGVVITADYTYYKTGTIHDSIEDPTSKTWDTNEDFNLWTLDSHLSIEGGKIIFKPVVTLTKTGTIGTLWSETFDTGLGGFVNINLDALVNDGAALRGDIGSGYLPRAGSAEKTFTEERAIRFTFDLKCCIYWTTSGPFDFPPSGAVAVDAYYDGAWHRLGDLGSPSLSPSSSDANVWKCTAWNSREGLAKNTLSKIRLYVKVHTVYEGSADVRGYLDNLVANPGYFRITGLNEGDVVELYDDTDILLDTQTADVNGEAEMVPGAASITGYVKVIRGTVIAKSDSMTLNEGDIYAFGLSTTAYPAVSPAYEPAGSAGWDQLTSVFSVGTGNTINYYILDASDDSVVAGPIDSSSLPYDISGIAISNIKVKIEFVSSTSFEDSNVDSVTVSYYLGGIDVSWDNVIVYDAIKKLAELFRRDFYYDMSKYNYLHIVTSRGRDYSSTLTFEVGVNLEEIREVWDYTSFANKVTVVGSDVTIVGTAQNDASISEMGEIHKIIKDKDVTDSITAQGLAEYYLDYFMSTSKRMVGKVLGSELREPLFPGDKVYIKGETIDEPMTVHKIAYEYKGVGAETLSIEFSPIEPELSDYLKDIDTLKRWV